MRIVGLGLDEFTDLVFDFQDFGLGLWDTLIDSIIQRFKVKSFVLYIFKYTQ